MPLERMFFHKSCKVTILQLGHFHFLEQKRMQSKYSVNCEMSTFQSLLNFIYKWSVAAAAAKSLPTQHSCPTLCDPMDGSPPGSSVPGILQARILEWVAISFSSNARMHAKSLQSYPTLCDPMDSSPPSSSVHRILQARILEWVAISFSNKVVSSYENLLYYFEISNFTN